jgi:hypothetical protein
VKRLLIVVAVVCAVLGLNDWLAPQKDLRAFDAAAVGKMDTEMWRSYYERHEVRLFWQLITLLRSQFGMPPIEATLNAYRAAHAAFVFKDGKSRSDYEKALPDLDAYYAAVSARSTRPFDAHRAAVLELEWWILHRERSPELAQGLAELQSAIYQVPAEKFVEHARLRAEAMVLRDDRDTAITEQDWTRIGGMLDQSWKSLWAGVH